MESHARQRERVVAKGLTCPCPITNAVSSSVTADRLSCQGRKRRVLILSRKRPLLACCFRSVYGSFPRFMARYNPGGNVRSGSKPEVHTETLPSLPTPRARPWGNALEGPSGEQTQKCGLSMIEVSPRAPPLPRRRLISRPS